MIGRLALRAHDRRDGVLIGGGHELARSCSAEPPAVRDRRS